MEPNQTGTQNAQLTSSSRSAVAYEQCKPEFLAASRGTLSALNIDPGLAVRTMLTAVLNAAPYRESIEKLPFCDHDLINKLEPYALGLGYANALLAWQLEGPKPTDALVEELRRTRKVLVTELELVQLRGILPEGSIKLEGTSSYNAMVQDVRAIATVFLANWGTVGPQIGGQSQHVEDALAAADQLVAALAESNQVEAKTESSQLIRLAAWNVAYRAYRELERVIDYLRFHDGDAQLIVPSLFIRGKGKRGERPVDEANGGQAEPSPAGGETPNLPITPVGPSKPF